MKNKNQIQLITSLLLAPVVINANDTVDGSINEVSVGSIHAVVFPNEELLVGRGEDKYSITYNKIIQQVKKQVHVEENIPMEIFIHEESTSIDINLGDISVVVPIEKASRHTLNVITRKSHDIEFSL